MSGRPLLLVFLAALAGCRSAPSEALVILDVSIASEVGPVRAVLFSVVEQPLVPSHEVPYDPAQPLKVGYYLPGPDGTATVSAQAIAGPNCVVGEGIAEVTIRVGQVSVPVPLGIAPIKADPSCLMAVDGATSDAFAEDAPSDVTASDANGRDASAPDRPRTSDAADARPSTAPPDAHMSLPPDAATVPPPPACLKPVQVCGGATACCAGLHCGSSSAGPQICCGDFNAACSRPNGDDCCGKVLPCTNGRCCLPAVWFCTGQGAECCDGRTCGYSSAGHVCCGEAGAPCSRADGKDCCGKLNCKAGHCG